VKRLHVLIVGAGRLGTALALRLSEAGYQVSKVVSHKSPRAKKVGADLVWFCVPDGKIELVAQEFSNREWRGKVAFHSSGALTSDALRSLRNSGGHVASAHPLMTFVKGSVPELAGVSFAVEGDPSAARLARQVVRALGGKPVGIKKEDKAAYHVFATMICPLLVSLLAASERTAALAGISEVGARRRMMPIIRQTLRNYEKLGPAGAFSGPIVRGDVEIIRSHLKTLAKTPAARNAYVALLRAALEYLPSENRTAIKRLLRTLSSRT